MSGLAEAILSTFRGREDYVAVGNAENGFAPHKLESPLKPEWLTARHLSQVQCLGFYVMREDNRVCCSCVDFDNKEESPDPAWKLKAEKLYLLLANVGLRPVVEISASGKAAHVWLFFSNPTEAWLVRAFWKAVSEKSEIPFREVFPKQDVLAGKGLGNLVRYPLWNQSRFVDVESEWTGADACEVLGNAKFCDEFDLRTIVFEMGLGELKSESAVAASGAVRGISVRVEKKLSRSHSLLSRRWNGNMDGMNDESRSALVQSIACELVRTYTPTAEVEQAIRHWCNEHAYEKGKRPEWITGTVAKAYDFVSNRTEVKSQETTTLKDAVNEFITTLTSEMPRHIRTGIAALDDCFDGVAPGEMAVIAARPGHGKSAFGLHWLDSAARDGLRGLIVSEEMSRLELGKRALLSITALEESAWGPGTVETLRAQATDHFERREIVHIVENCTTIDRCEEVIDQHCGIYGVKIVAVDYLQLLTGRGVSRYEDVSEISRRLKQVARRNECALLAMCQLNREIEKDKKREPKLSDLRESGQIEQDADLVVFLQWEIKDDFNADENRYVVTVKKRRNGPTRGGQRQVISFDPNRQRFAGPGAVVTASSSSEYPDFNQ